MTNASEVIENSSYVIKTPEEFKGCYSKLFGNDNPIHLEIGMGKGQFLIKMAKAYPNINFIGVEKYDTIVAKALLKLEEEKLTNIKIIRIDALELSNVFEHEIDTIYLNFSDPWPKNRHAKRRLTSHVFLPIYDEIFKNDKVIIQKTDNILLFASSIVSLSTYGYTIEDCNLDLANSEMFNCTTEYEDKFSSMGVKINYLKAIKK